MRAFKWDAVQNFSSMGTWDTKGQTLTLLNFLNERALSWNFWLWLVIILIPLEIKLHSVPHLKGIINGIYTSSGPRVGSLYIKTMCLEKTWFYSRTVLVLVLQTRFASNFILASVDGFRGLQKSNTCCI